MTGSAIDAAVELYLAHLTVDRGLSTNTLLAYRRDLTRYTAFLGSRGCHDPADVTEPDVEDFLVAVRTGSDGRTALSASSAARIVVAVRGWHRFLLQDGVTGLDPRARRAAARPAEAAAEGDLRGGRRAAARRGRRG